MLLGLKAKPGVLASAGGCVAGVRSSKIGLQVDVADSSHTAPVF